MNMRLVKELFIFKNGKMGSLALFQHTDKNEHTVVEERNGIFISYTYGGEKSELLSLLSFISISVNEREEYRERRLSLL